VISIIIIKDSLKNLKMEPFHGEVIQLLTQLHGKHIMMNIQLQKNQPIKLNQTFLYAEVEDQVKFQESPAKSS